MIRYRYTFALFYNTAHLMHDRLFDNKYQQRRVDWQYIPCLTKITPGVHW